MNEQPPRAASAHLPRAAPAHLPRAAPALPSHAAPAHLPRAAFFDEETHAEELARVFGACWLFVAHASEVAEPGDYVTRRMGRDEVVAIRDEAGTPRVHLNSCPHRGTQLCRAARGNTSHLRCQYHGWTFGNDGELRGVPGLRSRYPPDFAREDYPLTSARVDTLAGLVFATWNPQAPPLREELGAAAFYLEALLDRADGGFEVVGPPIRIVSRTDWKLATENFAHDSLHLPHLHGGVLELGVFAGDRHREQLERALVERGEPGIKPRGCWAIDCGGGHTVMSHPLSAGHEARVYLGYPPELWAQFDRNTTPAQSALLSCLGVFKGNVFPNLSFIEIVYAPDGGDAEPVAGTMLRQCQPLEPGRNEIFEWFLVPRDAPAEWKLRSQIAMVRTIGWGGSFEPDDLENTTAGALANRGPVARAGRFAYRAGAHLEPLAGSGLPGRVYASDVNTETMQREFYRRWLELMGHDGSEGSSGASRGGQAGEDGRV